MDALGLGGALTGATLVNLGIVLLWVRWRVGACPAIAPPGMALPVPRANSLPVYTGELDVVRPVGKPTSPERSDALPDRMHQGDARSDQCKDCGRERRAEDTTSPHAVAGNADAHRFMTWINSGLKDGSIRVNESRAPVHFVKEGMLLVSPRIFREYANRQSDRFSAAAENDSAQQADTARWIQRRVLLARWHERGNDGINFRSYRLMLSGKGKGRLSGMLIPSPERFVNPVLPANPLLIPFVPENAVNE
jgi:hypothetical protein